MLSRNLEQSLHRALGLQASTRASYYLYNIPDEVDALADGIRAAQQFFGGPQEQPVMG